MPSLDPSDTASSAVDPVSHGLRWRLLFLAAALLIFAGSVIDSGQNPVSAIDDKLQHLLAFAALAALARKAFPRRSLWRVLLPGLLAYGLAIECIQWLLPWREFSLLDLAADAAGLLPGALAAEAWQRRAARRAEKNA